MKTEDLQEKRLNIYFITKASLKGFAFQLIKHTMFSDFEGSFIKNQIYLWLKIYLAHKL